MKAKAALKATKEPLFAKYEMELKNMVDSLQKFINESSERASYAEVVPCDTEDEELQSSTLDIDGLTEAGETHLGGVKHAKNRFSSILN